MSKYTENLLHYRLRRFALLLAMLTGALCLFQLLWSI